MSDHWSMVDWWGVAVRDPQGRKSLALAGARPEDPMNDAKARLLEYLEQRVKSNEHNDDGSYYDRQDAIELLNEIIAWVRAQPDDEGALKPD